CYNCRGEGHVVREFKEPKRAKDTQYYKDKIMLSDAKDRGAILDAEAEALLIDMECTETYDESLALTTTTAFQVSHEDAYDSDVDDGPHAAAAFMENLSSTEEANGTSSSKINKVHSNASDLYNSDTYDNTMPYQQYLLLTEAVVPPTKKPSETHYVSPGEMYLQETSLLKTTLFNKEESIKALNEKNKKVVSKKKDFDERNLEEIVCLKKANGVMSDLLKTYQQPTHTIPMLFKRSNIATSDLHKTALGSSNPKYEETIALGSKSRAKMFEKPGTVKPINYDVLNNSYIKFVPQKELSRKQVYWQSASAVKAPFVHTRPAKSEVFSLIRSLKLLFPGLDPIIFQHMKNKHPSVSHECFNHTQQAVETKFLPFLNMFKKLVYQFEEVLVKEVKEFEKIFDELDDEYEQGVKRIKSLDITNRNLVRKIECLTSDSIANDVCAIVRTVDEGGQRVEAHTRNLNKQNRVDSRVNFKHSGFVSKHFPVCNDCGECLFFGNHDACVVHYLKRANTKRSNVKNVVSPVRKVWRPVSKNAAWTTSQWKPIGRTFSLYATYPLTRIAKPLTEPLDQTQSVSPSTNASRISRFPDSNLRDRKACSEGITRSVCCVLQVVQIVLWYLDSGCSRHMIGDRSKLINYVDKFIGTVRFRNDEFATIVGYGDYKLGDTIITRVYYVEGLKHNLFLVGQLCDADLEVALRQYTCHIRNKDMVDLLQGSRFTNLYSILLNNLMAASPVCLLSKASSTKSWLWHHLVGYDSRTKDETPEAIKKFIKTTQVALNITVCFVRTDNGMEFVNKILTEFYESVGITYNTSVPRTSQQNGVVERRNRTLMEAARKMLIFAKALMLLWDEAVAAACYTLNRSLVHTLHGKTYYELLKGKKPNVNYFRVFGSLCFPTNDSDYLGKLTAKADICIFVGYAPTKKAYRIYNKRTRKIQETVHVTFDELTEGLTPIHDRKGLAPNAMTSEFPPAVYAPPVHIPAASAPEIATGLPSITIITKDALAVNEDSQTPPPNTSVANQENPYYTSDSNSYEPYVAHETSSDASSSETVDVNVTQNSPLTYVQKWTKDHPLQNVIGDLNRSIKLDEYGEVLKNKARLVVKGYRQEAGNDFKESFTPRLKKALYRLKQAPRAWYDKLFRFLMSTGFSKGVVDPTLFTKKTGKHILLVQIYVDDIIFASTNPKSFDLFAHEMSSTFKMSMMGQMSFFLGLQVSQNPRGIFINQSKYALKILKKYGFDTSPSIDTPMAELPKLDEDTGGKLIDPTRYRRMVGSLMYLSDSRPDIVFAVCMCARYQAKPTDKHLQVIKRIFKYLKGTIHMGLWYLKDFGFALKAFADADYAGCQDTRRSTSGSA
nr:retrovirus-related Pol polyprotein from transposon TNT 1-94 [Tanacetum cinerariifolium]